MRLMIILFLSLLMVGCGQKGPLYLPDADDQVSQYDIASP
jgi:predicted small lipoprotein YifL